MGMCDGGTPTWNDQMGDGMDLDGGECGHDSDEDWVERDSYAMDLEMCKKADEDEMGMEL